MQDACLTSKNGAKETFAVGALRRGKQIEKFLGGVEHEGRQALRWLALGPDREGITLYFSEVEDVSSTTYSAIDNFPPIEPDDNTWGKSSPPSRSLRKHSTLPRTNSALNPAAGSTKALSAPNTTTTRWRRRTNPRTREVSALPRARSPESVRFGERLAC